MKLPLFITIIVIFAISGWLIFWPSKKAPSPTNQLPAQTALNIYSANNNSGATVNSRTSAPPTVNTNITAPASTVVVPIADFFNRITKKPFGIYVTPGASPVQPEKFTGYHTGADAETTPAEANVDVPILAMANGTVVFAGHVNGYGGVIIIRHTIVNETVTALYGHLRISSFTVRVGDPVTAGQQISVLGTGYSTETDGERKHLHLGIIKGSNINYLGYVNAQSELTAWYDPVVWLKAHGAS
jgi:murein DD-endopeptidase MepM/ murein hydrolase activator NlpD